ncbi:response regulator, partial [Candidatus Sumerlaeota bacterium]|nr:response regulator [Candidatus Sumerlaeota bacterium]
MKSAANGKNQRAEGRILIVDDEWSIRDILMTILVAEGYEVDCAEDGDAGLKLIEQNTYDLVITDLNMPGVSGGDILKHLHAKSPSTLGIVATGYGSLDTAVEALKSGAFDYITKPFHLEEIKIMIRKAREFQALRTENQTLR